MVTGVVLMLLVASLWHEPSAACNEAVCASLVSKCLLLKSCECDMTDRRNCTCCTDCHRCLARLYTDCCSCVGMCPAKKQDDGLQQASSIEELSDPIPDLFEVLTSEPDPHLRWTTYTYPAHLDLLYFNPDNAALDPQLTDIDGVDADGREVRRHGSHVIAVDRAGDAANCTVAYMSTCLSLRRCRESCEAMGAARYRWFHADACCQCIGATCLDYGRGESLCLRCPAPPTDDDQLDADYYYDVHEAEKYTEHGATVSDGANAGPPTDAP